MASFERTLISGQSAYDRFVFGGDTTALTAAQQRGRELFFGERFECYHCHGGFGMTDAVTFAGVAFQTRAFHNTGLYDIDGQGAYPAESPGVIEVTGNPDDMGRFKAPSLRNVAVTAPYMHDGSIATLEEALAHYAAGGRAQSPLRDELIGDFVMTIEERDDVVAFLGSLTDESFLIDPRFADPWMPQ